MPVRILIADDSPLVLNCLRSLLESHSNSWTVCAEARDGPQAIQKTLESKPDLVILDFQMPLMDGLRTSVRISKILPRLPILLYTIHKSSVLDLQAKNAGVREVISKSDSAALLRAVDELLTKSSKPPGSKESAANA